MGAQELIFIGLKRMVLAIRNRVQLVFFYCRAYCFVCDITLRIREIIQPPEKYLVLTDSSSSGKALLSRKISHQTHLLVYECK
jgi:hypothetical protein